MSKKVTQEVLTQFQAKMSEVTEYQYQAGLNQRRLETALARANSAREEHFNDTRRLELLHRASHPKYCFLGTVA